MSLSNEDLQAIRQVVIEVIAPIEGKLEALENDVKEIYTMLSELRTKTNSIHSTREHTLEERLLSLHTDLLEVADQANIQLPSH